ncbi:MAG TPA: CbtA family protein [Acidimicrobiales bacterium]|nr:CbtA family protein [Acidimicrobiales bacterium]
MIRRGVLAGAAGGASLALFLALVGQPAISRAIRLEAQRSRSGAEDELFSRSAQQIGGMVGAVAYGVCLGLIASLVLARAWRGQGPHSKWRRAMAVGAAGFVTVALLPFLEYPANPPGVGDPATVGRRTVLFVILLGWSVLAGWGSWRVAITLRERGWPEHLQWGAAVSLYAVAGAAALVVMPGSPDAVDVPATLLWQFRIASLGGSLLLWGVLGWVLGFLAERDARQEVS